MRSPRALFAFLLAATAVLAQSPAGAWTGAIEVPGTPLQITVTLRVAKETWTGDIDIPAQGAKALPLESIAVKGDAVTFAIADVPGEPTFEGTLAGDALAGTFTQGGQPFPFRLQRKAAAAAAEAAATEKAFAGFAGWLDETRAQFHAPGVAAAVVKGGRIVATFASGTRDAGGAEPVTADTLFAIGSSTKAFTTFVLATLVGEGKLDWDEPVRRWMPDFALADEVASERLTPRDLVTHRSGMPRHDLVWYGADLSRAEMVARMRHLPLSRGLRTDFQYNNLMFLCAGHLAERITGETWEALVKQRILVPLGMQRSNFSVADSQLATDHAIPCRKDDTGLHRIPFRDISRVGPAGSINSSVREMAAWVSLHLQGGEHDGVRLLAPALAKDLHRARMPVGASGRGSTEIVEVGYALGWFVDVYRGHRRVHHGGNIDGFSAAVAFLPDDGWGFVVLANLDGTPLPELVVRMLSDRALALAEHDWRAEFLQRIQRGEATAKKGREAETAERRTGTQPSRPLDEFAGEYRDEGYGPCTVTRRGDALAVDFHGLGAELEHWHLDVFRCAKNVENPDLEGTRVQFVTDFDGDVEALRVVLDPLVDPIVFRRQPDARLRDASFLRRLAGDYDLDGQTASFALQGSVLTVTMPGQHFELEPRLGVTFKLKGLTGYSLRFVLDAAETPTAVRFRQPDGVFEGKRKGR